MNAEIPSKFFSSVERVKLILTQAPHSFSNFSIETLDENYRFTVAETWEYVMFKYYSLCAEYLRFCAVSAGFCNVKS